MTRLKELIGAQSQKSFSDRIGVSQQIVSHWLAGNVPRKSMLNYIAGKLDLETHWLLTGQGPKDCIRTDMSMAKVTMLAEGETHYGTALQRLADELRRLCQALIEARPAQKQDLIEQMRAKFSEIEKAYYWEQFRAQQAKEENP